MQRQYYQKLSGASDEAPFLCADAIEADLLEIESTVNLFKCILSERTRFLPISSDFSAFSGIQILQYQTCLLITPDFLHFSTSSAVWINIEKEKQGKRLKV